MNRATATSIVAAAGIGVLLGAAFLPTLVLLLAASCIVASIALPVSWLPSFALAGFALLPVKQLPFPGEPAAINPGALIVLIWIMRMVLEHHRRTPERTNRLPWTIPVLALWCVVGVATAPRLGTSLGWTANFLVLALGVVTVARFDLGSVRKARETWIVLSSSLGAFALVEAFILKANPLYGSTYQTAQPALKQVWSVYRATTTMGHPLVNALFFSIGCVLAIEARMRRRGRWDSIAILLSAGGVIATASRAGVIAVVFGALTVVVLRSRARSSSRIRTAVLGSMLVIGVALAGSSTYLAERNRSEEAASSAAYRRTTLKTSVGVLAHSPVLGVGPGLADTEKKTLATGRSRLGGIENSWLELLVSLGPVGLLLTVLLVIQRWRSARASGDIAMQGVLVTYAVMCSAFNMIEAHLPGLLILGLVLAGAHNESESIERSADDLRVAVAR